MKALITGVTGFAGSYLAELLVSEDRGEVIGLHATDRHLQNVEAIKNRIRLEKINLLDASETSRIISEVKPDLIFHLAASAFVGDSFKKPAEFIANNSAAQINVLESVKENNLFDTKIVIVSSAHVYGLVKEKDLPIDEDTPFHPDSPYSVSKITQDYLGSSYYAAYNLKTIMLRPFNHIGPRLSPNISLSRFAKQIAEIEKGLQEPRMTVGNLDAKRDFTDVRDMVRAYVLSAEKCNAGEAYNIGTGVSHKIGDVLKQLLSLAKVSIDVVQDESLLRPSDIPELRCDSSRFHEATGWEPQISFEKTLQDTLDYWRDIV